MAYRIRGIDEPERVLSMLDYISDSGSELEEEEEDDIDRDLDGDISAMADMPVGVRFVESGEGTSAADGDRLSDLGSSLRNFFFYHGFADLLRHIRCPNLVIHTPRSLFARSAIFTG